MEMNTEDVKKEVMDEVKSYVQSEVDRAVKAVPAPGNDEVIKRLDSAIKLLDEFIEVYTEMWHTENKPFGFEKQQLRLGGRITDPVGKQRAAALQLLHHLLCHWVTSLLCQRNGHHAAGLPGSCPVRYGQQRDQHQDRQKGRFLI